MKVSALALVILLFSACDRGEKTATKSSGSSSSNSPAIKLLDAGKDPKHELRFAAKKGAQQKVLMGLQMGITMDIGGTPRTQSMPRIDMPMEVTVTDVTTNGDMTYRFELREPEIADDGMTAPGVVAGMKGALAGIAGLSGTAVVTNRGFTKSVDIKVPAGANPQVTQFMDSFKQSIGQMSAPLPEQAVGVGAKWETSTTISQNGMKLKQVATTEVIGIDGNIATLSIKLQQSADRQKVTSNGMTVDLESLTGSGGGETTIDLGKIVPATAKMSLRSDMKMKAGGQSMAMGFDVVMTMAAQ